MIKGIVKFIDPNKFGYTPTLNINGVKYGGDTKLDKAKNFPQINKGDVVEFEEFETEYNGKSYPKYKAQTLKVVPKDSAAAVSGTRNFGGGASSTYQQKEGYWADKAAEDAKRDPRISFQGALERAIAFADLAFRSESLPLPKTANKRLEVLEAFVLETANNFMVATYAATAPTAPAKAAKGSTDEPGVSLEEPEQTEEAVATEEWD